MEEKSVKFGVSSIWSNDEFLAGIFYPPRLLVTLDILKRINYVSGEHHDLGGASSEDRSICNQSLTELKNLGHPEHDFFIFSS